MYKTLEAMTPEQQCAFLHFVRHSQTYEAVYPFYMFMAGTGCRVGEATGLTWDEVDFNRDVITIRHQLQYSTFRANSTGPMDFHITAPKSANDARKIPMRPEVKEALLMQQTRQSKGNNIIVDGVSGFVFTTPHGGLMKSTDVAMQLREIRKAFQQAEIEEAALDGRKPIVLPHINPHSFRHTFYSLPNEWRK
jgi:integrase